MEATGCSKAIPRCVHREVITPTEGRDGRTSEQETADKPTQELPWVLRCYLLFLLYLRLTLPWGIIKSQTLLFVDFTFSPQQPKVTKIDIDPLQLAGVETSQLLTERMEPETLVV